MYISILGRQPALGIAELERLYGDVSWVSDSAALIRAESVDLARLGGSVKVGRVVATLPHADWKKVSQKIVSAYLEAWRERTGKLTVGISAYGYSVSPREVQRTGIILKTKLKGIVNIRLIPNTEAALSSATSHHNKLGLTENKIELLVVRSDTHTYIAESIGTQNITAYARRDQARPKRDAFVGMLPPKLAQIIVNLGGGATSPASTRRLLDPFCGTGVVLQEAALMGYEVYGTDLSEKMIDYSRTNLEWLADTTATSFGSKLEAGDAMTHTWESPIDVVACETYLGQPFSAPPSPAKLREVTGNCNHIVSSFLRNLAPQLKKGTQLCVAVPAWRSQTGDVTHLPLISSLGTLGFYRVSLNTVSSDELLYFREDQVVARQLLILEKA